MTTRMRLPTAAVVGVLSLACAVYGVGSPADAQTRVDRCAPQGVCLAVPADASDERVRSDHGAVTGDAAYDAGGNLLDRNGNIVAVPETPPSLLNPSGRPREVFVTDRAYELVSTGR